MDRPRSKRAQEPTPSRKHAPSDLELMGAELQRLWARLRDAERRCATIEELNKSEANAAREALAAARWEFSDVRQRLLRRLEVLALQDARAATARAAIVTSRVYASAENAETILQLVETLIAPAAVPSLPDPARLAARLADAIRLKGYSKPKMAQRIGIDVRTLNNLLHAKPTKAFSQELALQFVERELDSD